MKYPTLLGAMLALALLLAACGPAATEAPTMTTEPTLLPTDPPVTEPPATESPAATEPPVATDTATTDMTATAGVPVTGDATVNVSESTEYGPILVNGEGMSLYVFMADTQDAGTSACADDCAGVWPPLTTDGEPTAAEGVDETLLGTITREDGSTQITYNGWPLYLYAGDTAPGDTTGQGVEDEFGLWYLLSPAGEAIQQ